MITVLLYAVLAWLFFNFVFRFVIPVYKTTRRVKQQFREMQDRMQQQQNGTEPSPEYQQKKSSTEDKVPADDYIEFEEIRN